MTNRIEYENLVYYQVGKSNSINKFDNQVMDLFDKRVRKSNLV